MTRLARRAAGFVLLVAAQGTLLAVPRPAASQDVATVPALHAPVVTRHTGTFNGKRVSYTATVQETIVPNAAGRPSARLVSTAYTADGTDPATRPVIFICNGGPISPSHPLHILALGPRRLAIPPDLKADSTAFRMVDNTYTVLDVADLVFFDPASTGWSRVLEGVKPEEYYTVDADAQQMAAFIDQWLRQNNRRGSPVHLLGESYATIRVPEAVRHLMRLQEPIVPAGVFLMGQAANQLEINTRPQNILSAVAGLPSIAATAWYHRKIDRKGRTVYQIMDEAWKWAGTEYLTALFQGGLLDDASRQRIATKLQEFSGIPSAYFLANDLRIVRTTYLRELFKAEGMKLGWDDARYVGPANGPEPDAPPAQSAYPALMRHFRETLEVERTDEYRRRQFPVTGPDGRPAPGGGAWAYRSVGSPFDDYPYSAPISEAFKRNPQFRVVVGSGIYDMKTTTGAAHYLVQQSGWPRSRVRMGYYEGGHMAYTNEQALAIFAADVRALVTGW
jgi:carboxypeptidase C (cathepsin A)